MNRRNFLSKTGYTLGAGSILTTIGCSPSLATGAREWKAVRAQFKLSHERIQMAQMLLASHPLKVTPGGFHSFEYRWAVKEAFEFHLEIGKKKIQDRTHQLNTLLKEGMQNLSHVKLHTPVSNALSSGINCFEVKGMNPYKLVDKLHAMNIIGSNTPYQTVYARLTPCIINIEEEVQKCIKALSEIKW